MTYTNLLKKMRVCQWVRLEGSVTFMTEKKKKEDMTSVTRFHTNLPFLIYLASQF